MDILITGASGLIGLPTIRQLSQTHQVYALVRQTPPQRAMPNVSWVACDLAQAWDPTGFPPRVDVVIHLAQSRRFREFPAGALDMLAVNVNSTLRLLEYARHAGARQFILASSGGLYVSGARPCAESDALAAHDRLNFYLMTKLHAEELVNKYTAFFVTTILRPFFVYGTAQHPQMLIPRLIHSVSTRQPIRLAGTAGIRINPIYYMDFVEVLERCLTLQEAQTLNVGGREILSLRQIGEIIGAVVGTPACFTVEAGADGDLIGDIARLEQCLGYQPHTAFRDGIAQVYQSGTGVQMSVS